MGAVQKGWVKGCDVTLSVGHRNHNTSASAASSARYDTASPWHWKKVIPGSFFFEADKPAYVNAAESSFTHTLATVGGLALTRIFTVK